jgi:hypothetical protein
VFCQIKLRHVFELFYIFVSIGSATTSTVEKNQKSPGRVSEAGPSSSPKKKKNLKKIAYKIDILMSLADKNVINRKDIVSLMMEDDDDTQQQQQDGSSSNNDSEGETDQEDGTDADEGDADD